MLQQLHFAFLIRHPKYSVPSYYRCTVPPLDEMTGFYNYMPNEAGYDELRRLFDYLKESGQVGPEVDDKIVSGSGESNGVNGHSDGKVNICVVDADDLLDHPAEIIETFCKSVGIQYTPDMLNWDNEEDHRYAKEAFEKWKGFHEDAIYSSSLKPREHVSLTLQSPQEGVWIRCRSIDADCADRRRSRRRRKRRMPSGERSLARRVPRSSARR